MKKLELLASISDSTGYTASELVGLQQLLIRAYPIVCLSVMVAGTAKTLRMDILRIHLPADFKCHI